MDPAVEQHGTINSIENKNYEKKYGTQTKREGKNQSIQTINLFPSFVG